MGDNCWFLQTEMDMHADLVDLSSGLFSEETHFNSVDGKHWMKHKNLCIIFFDLLLGIDHKETKQITADKKQRLKQDDKIIINKYVGLRVGSTY